MYIFLDLLFATVLGVGVVWYLTNQNIKIKMLIIYYKLSRVISQIFRCISLIQNVNQAYDIPKYKSMGFFCIFGVEHNDLISIFTLANDFPI